MSTPRKVILFGDSLLGRFGITLIDQLENAVSDITVYNCAAGGLNTEDGVKRANYIAQLKPDYVIFSFGANDAAPWKKQVPETDFKNNYDSIIKCFSGSKIIVMLCPPANDPNDIKGTEEFNDFLSRYNTIVKAVAKENEVVLIDSAKIYGDLLENGTNYHKEDGIHLNEVGYDVLIKELTFFIR